tara:strand:+ start:867 stop:1277 length:411 start_codon:yes stop_codon:yes gene_type:complete
MDLGNLKLFKMALTQMDWAAQRQKVLSQNIANADTPGYQPHDLKKLDFKNVLQSETAPVKVTRSNPKHLKGTIPEQEAFRADGVRKTFEASPDGNKVIIEEQMQKVGSTRGDYNTAVTLMQAHMRMLKMATGSGGG